ncbi:hypothetical protein AVEN_188105-1 [Araneus ventricosus]|uniref:Uncharacterized protein n=2 Tax=Araneus ventricosus TaxID=182803 RepID=A0A4Y2JKM0_ARAVE|nr:hypothetical protein AVEN_166921-1 [Araneus ventricosus]GBM90620.1 hypothetical protein AVEN_188105-1 [Araneus ventricosus]
MTLHVPSFITLPTEGMSFKWVLDKRMSTLPSNMRPSPSGASLRISELRKEQEGVVACSVFTNLGVQATHVDFSIRQVESDDNEADVWHLILEDNDDGKVGHLILENDDEGEMWHLLFEGDNKLEVCDLLLEDGNEGEVWHLILEDDNELEVWHLLLEDDNELEVWDLLLEDDNEGEVWDLLLEVNNEMEVWHFLSEDEFSSLTRVITSIIQKLIEQCVL